MAQRRLKRRVRAAPQTIRSNQHSLAVLKSKPLRVGYVPLIDCAPFVIAQELGLFSKYDLNVVLSRQPGWATIRDKILYGDLEAAHALAVMPFAATLGLGSIRSECITGLVLNLHGNAITLSQELRQRGVRDARSLRAEIERNRERRIYTFGVVFQWSSHHFLLRHWLSAGGIDPDKDVRIVVVGGAPLFRYQAGDRVHERLAAALIAESGAAKVGVVLDAFCFELELNRLIAFKPLADSVTCDWHFHQFDLGEHHCGAVAVQSNGGAAVPIQFRDWCEVFAIR